RIHGAAVRPLAVPQAALPRRQAQRRPDRRPCGGDLGHERRRDAQGPRLLGRGPLPLEGAPEEEPLRRQARLPRDPHGREASAADGSRAGLPIPPPSPLGGGQMPPTAPVARPAKKAAPAPASVPGYAGKLLRVNLSTGKIWTEPWAGAMREYLGGVCLRAKILYEEVGPKVHWDHPDNLLSLPNS